MGLTPPIVDWMHVLLALESEKARSDTSYEPRPRDLLVSIAARASYLRLDVDEVIGRLMSD
jgi:hypothetical protein